MNLVGFYIFGVRNLLIIEVLPLLLVIVCGKNVMQIIVVQAEIPK